MNKEEQEKFEEWKREIGFGKLYTKFLPFSFDETPDLLEHKKEIIKEAQKINEFINKRLNSKE